MAIIPIISKIPVGGSGTVVMSEMKTPSEFDAKSTFASIQMGDYFLREKINHFQLRPAGHRYLHWTRISGSFPNAI